MATTKKRTYYNTTDAPVIIDDEGRILGGRERGEYEPTIILNRAVDEGHLVDLGDVVEEESKSSTKGTATNTQKQEK